MFLGRVAPWKGTREAAELASQLGCQLVVAGPTWEQEYANSIQEDFSATVEFVGPVGGRDRLNLLSRARAVVVLSQQAWGPWGQAWCEPGATVVSEAAACGIPIIASRNGCLPELIADVGVVVSGQSGQPDLDLLATLPCSAAVRAAAERNWGHIGIAARYFLAFQEKADQAK